VLADQGSRVLSSTECYDRSIADSLYNEVDCVWFAWRRVCLCRCASEIAQTISDDNASFVVLCSATVLVGAADMAVYMLNCLSLVQSTLVEFSFAKAKADHLAGQIEAHTDTLVEEEASLMLTRCKLANKIKILQDWRSLAQVRSNTHQHNYNDDHAPKSDSLVFDCLPVANAHLASRRNGCRYIDRGHACV
jgi:hypothetical protein